MFGLFASSLNLIGVIEFLFFCYSYSISDESWVL